MSERVRVIPRTIRRYIYRSAITGRFVSKAFALANQDSTYRTYRRVPVYRWVDPQDVLSCASSISIVDRGSFIRLQYPISEEELRDACSSFDVPFEAVLGAVVNGLDCDVFETTFFVTAYKNRKKL